MIINAFLENLWYGKAFSMKNQRLKSSLVNLPFDFWLQGLLTSEVLEQHCKELPSRSWIWNVKGWVLCARAPAGFFFCYVRSKPAKLNMLRQVENCLFSNLLWFLSFMKNQNKFGQTSKYVRIFLLVKIAKWFLRVKTKTCYFKIQQVVTVPSGLLATFLRYVEVPLGQVLTGNSPPRFFWNRFFQLNLEDNSDF